MELQYLLAILIQGILYGYLLKRGFQTYYHKRPVFSKYLVFPVINLLLKRL